MRTSAGPAESSSTSRI